MTKDGMYKIDRLFPNKNIQAFTGIVGRKEYVSMGMMFGKGARAQDVYMRYFGEPDIILKPIFIPRFSDYELEEITQDGLEKHIANFKDNLTADEQLIYYEKYIGEKFIGRDDFQFCGFDLMDDGLGCSAIMDCGDLNAGFVERLNQYGLLDCAEDAAFAQKQLLEDYPDEVHADTRIYGVWRYIKDKKENK